MDILQTGESAHYGMGTEMSHKSFGRHTNEALRAVEQEANRLERLFSRFIPESEVSRINASAGKGYETVSIETLGLLERALRYCEISQGLFDITIAPLTDLWDYKHANTHPPGRAIRFIPQCGDVASDI